MALGTGEHVWNDKRVNIGVAHRPILGAGGLEQSGLTVKLRGAGGYRTTVQTRPGSAGNIRKDTLINRPKLKTAAKPRNRRVSTARPVLGPIGTQPRQIIS